VAEFFADATDDDGCGGDAALAALRTTIQGQPAILRATGGVACSGSKALERNALLAKFGGLEVSLQRVLFERDAYEMQRPTEPRQAAAQRVQRDRADDAGYWTNSTLGEFVEQELAPPPQSQTVVAAAAAARAAGLAPLGASAVAAAAAGGFRRYLFSYAAAKAVLAEVPLPPFLAPRCVELAGRAENENATGAVQGQPSSRVALQSGPKLDRRGLFVGGALSGAGVHYHNAAYNVMPFGRKLWAVLPPGDAAWGTRSALEFFRASLPALRAEGSQVYVFVQEPGDIVFIPHMWGHATLNLRTSVGYSQEFNVIARRP
jgi:hypothetical protein